MAGKRFTRTRREAKATPPAGPSPAGLSPSEESQRSVVTLWRTAPPSTRGPKAALTLDGIAGAAIAIADADGLAGVSMSRIAERLGVTTMALYRYVPGKTELVDLMFDTAMGSPPDLGVVRGGWRPRIECWTRGLWAKVLAHPWALDVLARLRLPGPNELSWMESGARVLASAGLTGAPLLDALFLIVGQMRTVAQYTVAAPGTGPGLTSAEWATGVGAVLTAHAARFPTLVAATAAGAFAPVADPLAFGLERVLDGIELLIAQRATTAAPSRAGAGRRTRRSGSV